MRWTVLLSALLSLMAALLVIVPYFRRTLRSLRRLNLPEDDREQGLGDRRVGHAECGVA